MSQKTRVGVLFGGRSTEHDVSLLSARNVIEGLDRNLYEIFLIGIDRQGRWHLNPGELPGPTPELTGLLEIIKTGPLLAIVPGMDEGQIVPLNDPGSPLLLDVIFPVLHGSFGEDGTMQGLLKQINLPYVGPDHTGSVLGMDKEIMKRLLSVAEIPSAPYLSFTRKDRDRIRFEDAEKTLGLPCFIKPATQGSSVGVGKARNAEEFQRCVEEAFRFDNKILIEKNIEGREIECAVMGNEEVSASTIGEIIPLKDFYSYEAKYLDKEGARLEIPAKAREEIVRKIQGLAIRTYQVLECEGLTRVDFFLTGQGEIFVNEVNTLPGFTPISMYPLLWQEDGISLPDLLNRLIFLARDRYRQQRELESAS